MGKKSATGMTPKPHLSKLRITQANNSDNPLLDWDSGFDGVLELNHSSNAAFDVSCMRSSAADNKTFEWALDLTERNMKGWYDACPWGWSLEKKRSEFSHKTAFFIIIREKVDNQNKTENAPKDEPLGKAVGFSHFRFEEGSDESESAIYCYELQVEPEFQRLGLGAQIMELLYQIGKHFRMQKVMLTSLNDNKSAAEFYTTKLGYRLDKSSPENFPNMQSDAFYRILYKKISSK